MSRESLKSIRPFLNTFYPFESNKVHFLIKKQLELCFVRFSLFLDIFFINPRGGFELTSCVLHLIQAAPAVQRKGKNKNIIESLESLFLHHSKRIKFLVAGPLSCGLKNLFFLH